MWLRSLLLLWAFDPWFHGSSRRLISLHLWSRKFLNRVWLRQQLWIRHSSRKLTQHNKWFWHHGIPVPVLSLFIQVAIQNRNKSLLYQFCPCQWQSHLLTADKRDGIHYLLCFKHNVSATLPDQSPYLLKLLFKTILILDCLLEKTHDWLDASPVS